MGIRELGEKNARLKRCLNAGIAAEALEKVRHKEVIQRVVAEKGMAIRLASETFSIFKHITVVG